MKTVLVLRFWGSRIDSCFRIACVPPFHIAVARSVRTFGGGGAQPPARGSTPAPRPDQPFNGYKTRAKNKAEAGFSVLEPLMAVIVLTILMSAVAPVMLLSVATRVQARRLELATQAARGYIDMVDRDASKRPPFARTNVLQPNDSRLLPLPAGWPTNLPANALLQRTDAPNSVALDCPVSNAYCASPPGLFCYSFDNMPGCSDRSFRDVIVQPIRSTTYTGSMSDNPSTYRCVTEPLSPNPSISNNCNPNTAIATGDDHDQGYRLAVRVYAAAAFNKGGGPLGRSMRQRSYTAGLGDSQAPIVEFTTEVYSTNSSRPVPLLGDLCKRMRGSAKPTCQPSN